MKQHKRLFAVVAIILSILMVSTGTVKVDGVPAEVIAANEVVVVIDPGHGGFGGTNEGAIYNGYVEKVLTLQTAAAMKQVLEQFQNVKVYLTRIGDVEMSLEERARFAKSVNADFLFSLHYNASAAHNVYGSEVWVPSSGSYYAKGYAFGTIMTEEFASLGLYQRGVKTRIGQKGDYYGIIRNGVALGIPSVIIEHAHLDHGVDLSFLNGENAVWKLGYADAIAVAKYFGLRSASLGLDFSGYQKPAVAAPKAPVGQDTTPPEICRASRKSYDPNTRTLVMNCTAQDSGSQIIYYAVSYNNGLTYTILFPWNRTVTQSEIAVQVPQNVTSVIFRAYNQYDKYTDSAPVPVY